MFFWFCFLVSVLIIVLMSFYLFLVMVNLAATWVDCVYKNIDLKLFKSVENLIWFWVTFILVMLCWVIIFITFNTYLFIFKGKMFLFRFLNMLIMTQFIFYLIMFFKIAAKLPW